MLITRTQQITQQLRHCVSLRAFMPGNGGRSHGATNVSSFVTAPAACHTRGTASSSVTRSPPPSTTPCSVSIGAARLLEARGDRIGHVQINFNSQEGSVAQTAANVETVPPCESYHLGWLRHNCGCSRCMQASRYRTGVICVCFRTSFYGLHN